MFLVYVKFRNHKVIGVTNYSTAEISSAQSREKPTVSLNSINNWLSDMRLPNDNMKKLLINFGLGTVLVMCSDTCTVYIFRVKDW